MIQFSQKRVILPIMEGSKTWIQNCSLKLNRVQYKVPLGEAIFLLEANWILGSLLMDFAGYLLCPLECTLFAWAVLRTPPTKLQNYNLQTTNTFTSSGIAQASLNVIHQTSFGVIL